MSEQPRRCANCGKTAEDINIDNETRSEIPIALFTDRDWIVCSEKCTAVLCSSACLYDHEFGHCMEEAR